MPELPEMEAWRRALDGPVSAFPIEKAGPAHIATLKTFDPPLAALEGRRLDRRPAPRETAPLPDRGRRARPARAPDDGGPPPLPRGGREGAEDPCVPAQVPGRRRARPDRGRVEEAGRRLAVDTRGGHCRAGAHRPGGERAGRGAARPDPRLGLAAPALASSRPEADRGHRPRLGERDPARGPAFPVRADQGCELRRSRTAGLGDQGRVGARPRAA